MSKTTDDRIKSILEIIKNTIFTGSFPKERWTCSKDIEDVSLSMGRYQQWLSDEIEKELTKFSLGDTALEEENKKLKLLLRNTRNWVVNCSENRHAKKDLVLIDEALKEE